jgi:vancomycin resistance protein YoaR
LTERERRRRRRRRRRSLFDRVAIAILLIALVTATVALAFAGSPQQLSEGVRIAGIDVGGMKKGQALELLEARSAAVAQAPVSVRAGGHTWHVTARQLGVRADWRAAVATAAREGAGPAPVRGFRRLGVRLFGADITPPEQANDAALRAKLAEIADAVDRPHVDAALKLEGLKPVVVPGQNGLALDKAGAARALVRALGSLTRPASVELSVQVDPPSVSAADLAPALAQARTAVSAPVRLAIGPTRLRLPRYRIAQLLDLPRDGRTSLRIAGPRADAFFLRLQKELGRKPHDARFEVTSSDRVRVVAAQDGRAVDVPASVQSILHAALSPYRRLARLAVETAPPKLTTAAAKGMGVKGVVGTYTTEYGGVPNRIHNVQLVAHLIDDHLIAPGDEFSFNKTTGERNAAKGFLEAPVIVNGELQTGLGGGVCQVSTTVFNAAYEAGLKITSRTNHALYISHYPLGRDATVNYPDVDLRFVNDTGHWLWLRTYVGSYSLTVTLYGTNPHRKVVTEAAPLEQTGPIPVKKTKDPTLAKGDKVVDDPGEASYRTSVHRIVYDRDGKVLYDDTWYSSYRSSPKLVRIGTKKPGPAGTTTTTQTTKTPQQ